MKQMQQIKGYGHELAAHTAPISTIKQLQEKQPKHQSLIQKCMKALVKEKMTGCIINAQRKKRELQQSFSPSASQSSISGLQNYLNSSIKNHRYSYNPETSAFKSDKVEQSRHQSTLASLHDHLSKRYSLQNVNHGHLLTEHRNKNNITSQDKSKQKVSINGELSFISAVDHGDQENDEVHQANPGLNNSKLEQAKQLLKLPKIKGRQSTVLSASPTTLIKNIIKKSSNYNIRQDFWQMLSNSLSQPKQRQRRNSTSINDLQNSTSKQIKSSLFKPTVPSSSRESFQNYLQNLPTPFKKLIEFVLNFFQIKIPNQLSALFYSNMLDELRVVHQRAWAVVCMGFWDWNRDGVIKADDVFQVFKEFYQFGKINQNYEGGEKTGLITNRKLKKQNQTIPIRKPIVHERNSNKQLMSSTQEIVNALKYYKIKQQPQFQNEIQKQLSTTPQISRKQQVLCLQSTKRAIFLFQAECSRLNTILSSSTYQQIDIQSLLQPTSHPICYLEQILLYTPQLCYKNIVPLLSIGDTKMSMYSSSMSPTPPNSSKLQIFSSQVSVKCSSSYKQCFISTQHNEQTRLLRQRIQYYKQQLKKKREERNKLIKSKFDGHIKVGKEIGYAGVVEGNLGKVVKDVVMSLLGLQD